MSSKAPLVILIAGTLAVVGLVGWAMMRSIDAPIESGTTGFVPPTASASTAAAPPSDAAHAAVPLISPDELKAKMDKNQVTVIDVRDAESFQRGHIPGARHIPFARIEGEIDYLPKGKDIVLYCSCPAEETSAGAARILQKYNITNVAALKGGFTEWQSRGYLTALEPPR